MTHPAVKKYNRMVVTPCIADAWQDATFKQQEIAKARHILVLTVKGKLLTLSAHQAFKTLVQELKAQTADAGSLAALRKLPKVPSVSTLRNWLKAYEQDGMKGLLPSHKGTQRQLYGWEATALELFHCSTKPSLAKVARDLTEQHGFDSASEHNVRYFFSGLPSELQEKSPWRLGQASYRKKVLEYIQRTTEDLPVGLLYQGDGHCIDVYCKHPVTGKLYRPELTVFMDIRSRRIVGWFLSDAESSITSMAALSQAFGSHDHVCAALYIDNGCGYKSKLMTDESAGFYKSFDLEVIFSLPGNPQAKGNVERFFGVMENDFGKNFDTYCGKDQSTDISRHFNGNNMKKLKELGLHVPTVSEWATKFEQWLETYHNRPHPEVEDQTPNSLWETLENTPVVDLNLLVRPRKRVKVSRSTVRMFNRYYRADYLYQFEGQELVAEYEWTNDRHIRLFNLDGQLLMTAELKSKKAYLSSSFIEDAKAKTLQGKLKRIDNKRRDVEMQSGLDIDAINQTNLMLSHIDASITELDQQQQPSNDDDNVLDELTRSMTHELPVPEAHDDPLDLLLNSRH